METTATSPNNLTGIGQNSIIKEDLNKNLKDLTEKKNLKIKKINPFEKYK